MASLEITNIMDLNANETFYGTILLKCHGNYNYCRLWWTHIMNESDPQTGITKLSCGHFIDPATSTLQEIRHFCLNCNLYGCFSPQEHARNALKTWIFKGDNKAPCQKFK